MAISTVTRRRLLIGAGGSIAVAGSGGLWLAMDRANDMLFRKAVDRDSTFSPNAFLSIPTNGPITIWVPRAEMGQGVSTALPILLAEELDANWQDIRVEQAVVGTDIDHGQHFTVASSSISGEFYMFRRAGAVARAMLLGAAADKMSVSESECHVANGVISHPGSGQSLTFGEVALEAADQWAPVRPKLKNPNDYTLIGQPGVKRLDTGAKVTGQAIYGMDVVVPNMVRAVVARPPFFGASLSSYDDREARTTPGVLSIHQISAGVAVVAEDTFAAMEGRKRLKCDWSSPPADAVSSSDIETALHSAIAQPDLVEVSNDAAVSTDGIKVAAEYQFPFLAHACMEPMNCTTWVHDGQCEIWAPTQAAKGAQRTAAEITGLPQSAVRVHVTQLGGGFGRRAADDFIRESVELATNLDRPVQLLWTREDDIAHAMYRPAAAHKITATIDASSALPVNWVHHLASATRGPHYGTDFPFTEKMGSANLPYAIERQELGWSAAPTPLPTQIWRSVGYSYNTFVVESFVNEIAEALDEDPVSYRRRLLTGNPRLLHCLNEVADIARWQLEDRHLGVATHYFSSTAVAMIAEVQGESLQNFKVTKVWCVVDCGTPVHLDGVIAQIEGGIIDGLSAILYGKISVRDNAVQESNFHNYPLLRMPEAPAIQVEVVASDAYPSGVGEASLPGIGPAVAAALHQMTGQRIRTLPIKT